MNAPRRELIDPAAAPPAELYRLRAAAELLGTPYETVRRWVQRGTLRAQRIGESVYVERAEVDRFLAAFRSGELARPRRGARR